MVVIACTDFQSRGLHSAAYYQIITIAAPGVPAGSNEISGQSF